MPYFKIPAVFLEVDERLCRFCLALSLSLLSHKCPEEKRILEFGIQTGFDGLAGVKWIFFLGSSWVGRKDEFSGKSY